MITSIKSRSTKTGQAQIHQHMRIEKHYNIQPYVPENLRQVTNDRLLPFADLLSDLKKTVNTTDAIQNL